MANDDPFADLDLFGDESPAAVATEKQPEPEPPKLAAGAIVFDIETGGLPEPELRAIYTEPSYEDFAAGCDKRWKPETVRAKYEEQKGNGWAEFAARAALSPLTGSVVAIGYWHRDFCEVHGVGQPWSMGQVWDERRILEAFWRRFDGAKASDGRLIGFNSNGFDLPFIVRRSWKLGVSVPGDALRDNRYWHRVFVDLMAVWGCGNYGERCSLDKVSRYFGGPGKNGDGAEFARLWNGTPEERLTAIAYLKNDLVMTAGVARKIGVV